MDTVQDRTFLRPADRTLSRPAVAPPEREQLRRIPLGLLRPRSDQPRRRMGERGLTELAESIRAHGVLQPIRARQQGEVYRIIAGERRWRAARMAGLREIPAIIVERDDERAYLEALIENVQREELNAVDRALALKRLRVTYGLGSWQEVGELVGLSRQHVHNLLKVTRLPEVMREDVRAGDLTGKHARALLRLEDRPEEQTRLWERIHAEKLSARAADRAARSVTLAPTPAPPPPTDLADLPTLVDEMMAGLTAAGTEGLRAAHEQLLDLHHRLTRVLERR
jgi:ParB family transcriptional regulator, chromosome partitioning protein